MFGHAHYSRCWLVQWSVTTLEGLSIPNSFDFLAKLYGLKALITFQVNAETNTE